MKQRSLSWAAACTAAMLAGAPPLAAQQSLAGWTGPKTRIAVMNLGDAGIRIQGMTGRQASSTIIELPPPEEFALGLTEMLTTALTQTDRFVVLERANLAQLTTEQDLTESGRVRKETGAAAGQMTGAQIMITGDITGFSYQAAGVGGSFRILRSVGGRGERVTAKVLIDVRTVDATTGEVLWSKSFQGTAAMLGVSGDFTKIDKEFATSATRNTPLGQASRQAIEAAVAAIVANIKSEPWSGRVVDVRNGKVYINAGSDTGITAGMKLAVTSQDEPLIDPQTGRTLAVPETKVGTLEVESVQASFAICRVTSGEGFQRNHVVKVQ